MALYEITETGLEPHSPAAFADLGLYERADLQRLLRDDIAVLGEDLLIVGEEFGEWEDARRRIDLLAVDRDGRLVVIELKRGEDGGHMDLQALRYAAMVASMSFEDVVSALASYLARRRPEAEVDARAELVAFLEGGQGEEGGPIILDEVRILLAAADFGRELTTAVLWLNRFEGMDIRCVRVVPYRLHEAVMLDVQQVVPLPEAGDYQVRLRRKERQRERARSDNRDFTRYHVVVDGQALPDENKRNAVRLMVTQLLERGVAAAQIAEVLSEVRFRSVEGEVENTEELVEAFGNADERFDRRRWFVDHAFRREGRTWLLRKQWGTNTEPTLEALANAFPEARLTFQPAEG